MPVTRFLLILLILLNLLALATTRGWLGESVQRGEPERLTNQINPQAITLRPPEERQDAPVVRPPTIPLQPEPEPASTEVAPPPAESPHPPSPPVADMAAATVVADEAAPDTSVGVNDEIAPVPEVEPAPVFAPSPAELTCTVYQGLGEQQAATLGRSAVAIRPQVQANQRMTEAAGNWWVHIPAPANRGVAEDRVATLRASGINDLFIVRDEGPHKNAISLGIFRTENSAKQHLSDLRARRVTDARIIARKPAVFALELRGTRPDLDEVTARLKDNPYGVVAHECSP